MTIPTAFGFTHGERDGLVYLRAPDGRYKRLNPELRDLLVQVARGELAAERLDPGARAAAEQLGDEGFLVPDGPLTERATPPDIRLAPRLLLFGGALAAVAALVAVRWEVAWPPPCAARDSGSPASWPRF